MKSDPAVILTATWAGVVFAIILALAVIPDATGNIHAVALPAVRWSPFAAIYLAWVLASRHVALQRGRTAGEGIVMGLIFGPLGPLVVGAMPVVSLRAQTAPQNSRAVKTMTPNPINRASVIPVSHGR